MIERPGICSTRHSKADQVRQWTPIPKRTLQMVVLISRHTSSENKLTVAQSQLQMWVGRGDARQYYYFEEEVIERPDDVDGVI